MAQSIAGVARNQWVRAGLGAALLEAVVVGGTALIDSYKPIGRPLDALAFLLLVLGGGAVGFAKRWPAAAFATALGATTAFYAVGYPSASPIFLGLIATLYAAAAPDKPWRSVAMGAITIATLVERNIATSGLAGLNGGTAAGAGWAVAAILIGHAVSGHRVYVAATEERARRAEQTREAEAQRRVTEERLRIARELHDVVSHTISLINVQAGVAAHVLDSQPEEARQALLAIKGASKEALRELRGILGVLRQVDGPESKEPAPGLAQLPLLVEMASKAGLPVRLSVEAPARPLSPAADLAAYRIIQEALTNALRYAGPATAAVTVACEDSHVCIEVTDDGHGLPQPSAGSGLGLAGMRERAQAAGGQLEAGPLPGRGYRVRARLPVVK